MNRKAFTRNTLVSLLIVLSTVATARSADKSWSSSSGGSFQLDTNWTSTGTPGANDNAIFNLNAANAYTVTFVADTTNQQLLVRHDSTSFDLKTFTYSLTAPTPAESVIVGETSGDVGNVKLSNGTLSSVAATVGKGANAAGNVFLQSNATWSLSGPLIVGASGVGGVSNEGSVNGTSLAMAVETGSKGGIEGFGGHYEFSGLVQVGVHGTASVSDNDMTLKCQTLDIGVFAGSKGNFEASEGANIQVVGLARIGVAGSAEIRHQGSPSDMSFGSAILAEKAGSQTEILLEDFSTMIVDTTLDVGVGGAAFVGLSAEAELASKEVRIGVLAGSDGSIVATSFNGQSTWIANGDVTVGDAGKGSASVRAADDDQTATAKGDVYIARKNGSKGTADVTGDAINGVKATWNIDGALIVAGDKNAGHTGTGTLFIEQVSTVNVGGGTTVWKNGRVQLNHDSTLASPDGVKLRGGTLSGSGNVVGDVNSEGGHIVPGNFGLPSNTRINAGTLLIDGVLSMDSKSTLDIGLGGTTQGDPGLDFGVPLPGGYDFVHVDGAATLGGVLSVGFFNGFENQVKETDLFTILDASNPLVGIFKNVANGGRLKTTNGLFTFKVNYGESSAFDPSDVVLSDAQPFNGPVVPLPPMVWSSGAMLAGLVATRLRMNRRAHA